MAIAKNHVEEIYVIINAWIPDVEVQLRLFEGLRKTQAFMHNKSFRETIEMIENRIRREKIGNNLREIDHRGNKS